MPEQEIRTEDPTSWPHVELEILDSRQRVLGSIAVESSRVPFFKEKNSLKMFRGFLPCYKLQLTDNHTFTRYGKGEYPLSLEDRYWSTKLYEECLADCLCDLGYRVDPKNRKMFTNLDKIASVSGFEAPTKLRKCDLPNVDWFPEFLGTGKDVKTKDFIVFDSGRWFFKKDDLERLAFPIPIQTPGEVYYRVESVVPDSNLLVMFLDIEVEESYDPTWGLWLLNLDAVFSQIKSTQCYTIAASDGCMIALFETAAPLNRDEFLVRPGGILNTYQYWAYDRLCYWPFPAKGQLLKHNWRNLAVNWPDFDIEAGTFGKDCAIYFQIDVSVSMFCGTITQNSIELARIPLESTQTHTVTPQATFRISTAIETNRSCVWLRSQQNQLFYCAFTPDCCLWAFTYWRSKFAAVGRCKSKLPIPPTIRFEKGQVKILEHLNKISDTPQAFLVTKRKKVGRSTCGLFDLHYFDRICFRY